MRPHSNTMGILDIMREPNEPTEKDASRFSAKAQVAERRDTDPMGRGGGLCCG